MPPPTRLVRAVALVVALCAVSAACVSPPGVDAEQPDASLSSVVADARRLHHAPQQLRRTQGDASASSQRPFVIIGHRGGVLHSVPEHTVLSYTLGAASGADYLEPDVVSTSDGVLIVRHDIELGYSTDVAVKFPDRRATKEFLFPTPHNVTDWFVDDFTLEEIRTLTAISRTANASTAELFAQSAGPLDGTYSVMTLGEMLNLTRVLSERQGRPIGVYPETKRPHHFRAVGLPLEERLLETLAEHGFVGVQAGASGDGPRYGRLQWHEALPGMDQALIDGAPCGGAGAGAPDGSGEPACLGPVILQSFEPESLIRMRAMMVPGHRVPQVQLVYEPEKAAAALAAGGPDGMLGVSPSMPWVLPRSASVTAVGLQRIAEYADGVSPHRRYFEEPVIGDWEVHVASLAHVLGLHVHTYVEDRSLVQYDAVWTAGVDGAFTNDVSYAAGWRDSVLRKLEVDDRLTAFDIVIVAIASCVLAELVLFVLACAVEKANPGIRLRDAMPLLAYDCGCDLRSMCRRRQVGRGHRALPPDDEHPVPEAAAVRVADVELVGRAPAAVNADVGADHDAAGDRRSGVDADEGGGDGGEDGGATGDAVAATRAM